jgi:hypothetical protein
VLSDIAKDLTGTRPWENRDYLKNETGLTAGGGDLLGSNHRRLSMASTAYTYSVEVHASRPLTEEEKRSFVRTLALIPGGIGPSEKSGKPWIADDLLFGWGHRDLTRAPTLDNPEIS